MINTPRVLAAILALASLPLVAQQPPTGNPQNSPNPTTEPSTPPSQTDSPAAVPQQPGNPPATQPDAPPATPPDATAASAAPAAPLAELRPVKGELVSKLDTKTAKTGDDVVVQTSANVKTADGTEIPKGTKLMGHVVAVQSSASGQNSQVALKLDHAELNGGQSVSIQSQIQAIGSTATADDASPSSRGATSEPAAGGSSANPGASPSGTPNNAATAPGYTPGYSPSPAGAGSSASASGGAPSAGTVVARNGKIAIQTTGIPDVLLANNEPGQQDPRMEQASSILLGAKKDVQLDGGTPMVIAIAVAPGSPAAK